MKIIIRVLLIAGAMSMQLAHAEGDAAKGAALGYSCLGCHGIEAIPRYYASQVGLFTPASKD